MKGSPIKEMGDFIIFKGNKQENVWGGWILRLPEQGVKNNFKGE